MTCTSKVIPLTRFFGQAKAFRIFFSLFFIGITIERLVYDRLVKPIERVKLRQVLSCIPFIGYCKCNRLHRCYLKKLQKLYFYIVLSFPDFCKIPVMYAQTYG